MYFQMVIFITLTVFFSPIITLEARTLFEVPTTVKGPVIKNPFIPPHFKDELEKDILEISEKRLEHIAHKYWLKKRAHSVTETQPMYDDEEVIQNSPKSVENVMKSDSMKQFIKVCTHSFANAKIDNLLACVLEVFKET